MLSAIQTRTISADVERSRVETSSRTELLVSSGGSSSLESTSCPVMSSSTSAASPRRRQILSEHRRIHDEHAAQTDPGQEPERRQGFRTPGEGGESRKDGVPEDRAEEDAAAADPVGEPTEHDAAYERAAERRGRDPAGEAARQPPDGREDRDREADEKDLHRHECPRESGEGNGFAVKRRKAATPQDVLHVEPGWGMNSCFGDCHGR